MGLRDKRKDLLEQKAERGERGARPEEQWEYPVFKRRLPGAE
jgi:hypothetical protein